MKVLIYGLNFAPEIVGIGKYTGELAEFLREKEHKVRVICSVPYYPNWKVKKNSYSIEQRKNIKIYRCPIWVPKRINGIKRLIHLVSFTLSSLPVLLINLFNKADIIYVVVPSLSYATSLILLLNFFNNRPKLILHIQDFEIDAAFNLKILKGEFLRRKLNLLETYIINKFDLVSTISNSMKKILRNKKINVDKIIIPNWVDTKLVFPIEGNKKNHYREILKISQKDFVLMYSGTLSKKQGIENIFLLCDQFKNNLNIKWIIAGEGPLRDYVIEKAGKMKNIFVLKFQPVSMINEWLNLPDVHLIPQKKEAEDLVMPSKLYGILASAKPFISNASKESELGKIADQFGIRAEPNNIKSLVKAINKLYKNPKLRKILGKKGRDYVVNNFDKNKVLSELQNQMIKLIN